MASDVSKPDGSFDFSSGVDASRVTTVQSALTPHGLPRNMTAWMTNATCRGGGITCRTGWKPLVNLSHKPITTPSQLNALIATAATALAAYNTAVAAATAAQINFNNKYAALAAAAAALQASPTQANIDSYNAALAAEQIANTNLNTANAAIGPAKIASEQAAADVSNALNPTGVIGGLFQGGIMYDAGFDLPYLIASIGGRIYKISCEPPFTFTDLSAQFNQVNPSNPEQAFFVQAYEFLVIQAGDYPGVNGQPATFPLFWDGKTLRRSKGITNTAIPAPAPNVNEIPAALAMDFYMDRIWYAQGRSYSAGDIVGGPSGTAPYNKRDSVLNVTENPLCFGGDGFQVPTSAGNIRAIKHTNSTNDVLGQGDLYVGTRKVIYKQVVPVTRTDWIAASSNNMPKRTVAQNRFGWYGDRCVVQSNTDLFYRAPDGIRSLLLAIQNFGTTGQYGNTPISNNENRIFPFEDRSLLHFASGIQFSNRMYQTCLPIQTPVGVAFQGIMPLDFDLISTLQEKQPPAWEGILEGLKILQLWEGDFGGLQRAFAAIVSEVDGSIEIWELTDTDRFDSQDNSNGGDRIEWSVEFPAFTWGKEFEMKRLIAGELWVDKILGKVSISVEWRPDADSCWHPWFSTEVCTARNSCEDLINPNCYPTQPYRENQKFPIQFPKPPEPTCNTMNARPLDIGYQHQVRITVKGWMRIRGLMLYALPFLKEQYQGLSCGGL